jgi:hypothetical protein
MRDGEMVEELPCGSAPLAFRDIRRHGDGGPSHLSGEVKRSAPGKEDDSEYTASARLIAFCHAIRSVKLVGCIQNGDARNVPASSEIGRGRVPRRT